MIEKVDEAIVNGGSSTPATEQRKKERLFSGEDLRYYVDKARVETGLLRENFTQAENKTIDKLLIKAVESGDGMTAKKIDRALYDNQHEIKDIKPALKPFSMKNMATAGGTVVGIVAGAGLAVATVPFAISKSNELAESWFPKPEDGTGKIRTMMRGATKLVLGTAATALAAVGAVAVAVGSPVIGGIAARTGAGLMSIVRHPVETLKKVWDEVTAENTVKTDNEVTNKIVKAMQKAAALGEEAKQERLGEAGYAEYTAEQQGKATGQTVDGSAQDAATGKSNAAADKATANETKTDGMASEQAASTADTKGDEAWKALQTQAADVEKMTNLNERFEARQKVIGAMQEHIAGLDANKKIVDSAVEALGRAADEVIEQAVAADGYHKQGKEEQQNEVVNQEKVIEVLSQKAAGYEDACKRIVQLEAKIERLSTGDVSTIGQNVSGDATAPANDDILGKANAIVNGARAEMDNNKTSPVIVAGKYASVKEEDIVLPTATTTVPPKKIVLATK